MMSSRMNPFRCGLVYRLSRNRTAQEPFDAEPAPLTRMYGEVRPDRSTCKLYELYRDPEIRRCLKRYVARELFRALTAARG